MNLIKFSQMLCSRLCHDLITPIGAINTSLELLEESDPEDRLQLLELAKQSAEKAIRKLVFCRAAFAYSSDSHLSTIDQAKKLLQDFLMLNKIELLWEKEIQQSSEISSTFSQYAQVIANLSFICAEIAPYGGQLLIEFIKPQIIRLHLKGKLVPLRPIILSSLTGELSEDEMSSHVIQAIYTRMLCEKLYLALEINHQERVSLEFILRGND